MNDENAPLVEEDTACAHDPAHAHLQHRFQLERRESTKKAAILELDLNLDEFNAMDSSSFSDSDELLRQIAERLRQRLRDNDVVLPVTGGDKFMVLLEDIQSPDNADKVANELMTLLTRPYELSQSNDVNIGTKISISFFAPTQDEETDTQND